METALKFYKKHVLNEYVKMIIILTLITLIAIILYFNQTEITFAKLKLSLKEFNYLLFAIPSGFYLIASLFLLYKLRPSAKLKICNDFTTVEKCVKAIISKSEIDEAIEYRKAGCSVLTSEMMNKVEEFLPYKIKNLWEILNLILDKHEKLNKEEAIQT